MEFTEVIKNRYSCKKYAERQISDESKIAIPAKNMPNDRSLTSS